jgi:AhpD family alkylhydroperoxidase
LARVRNIPSNELPADLAVIYERFAGLYGPFRNQVAVFAHVPAALRHLMSMLIELRDAATLPKRALELAIVTVSKLNACHYCVAHHTPFLVVEGVSPAGIERLLDYRDHPELDERDMLVVEYAIAAWDRPNLMASSHGSAAISAKLRSSSWPCGLRCAAFSTNSTTRWRSRKRRKPPSDCRRSPLAQDRPMAALRSERSDETEIIVPADKFEPSAELDKC